MWYRSMSTKIIFIMLDRKNALAGGISVKYFLGAGSRTRTYEAIRREIYSLL